jgi:hypothetical protein
MPGEFDSQHCRDSAEKARAKADQMKDRRAKRRLLGLADFYKHRHLRHAAKSK